ncbi:hypothetical protein E2562_034084 [Oryza meyeriana var. granulata]|uniref:Uncharacterized protein n=1 Tax=Oryza meyeriana var. granulata TaxID=110450 RepID=A0A6G1DSI3_9ORYZ|nr:hypothetical protein E2562_034084 [Oryza meyeriana var. granulata]
MSGTPQKPGVTPKPPVKKVPGTDTDYGRVPGRGPDTIPGANILEVDIVDATSAVVGDMRPGAGVSGVGVPGKGIAVGR